VPIYEYRCNNGHTFEVVQRMSDPPVTTCQECGAPVERVFHPIAVHFKGSGFYTTDYAKKGAAAAGGDGKAESKPDAKSEGGKPEASKSKSDSGSGDNAGKGGGSGD
jgi:putative FmdB family regulatory protein